MIVGEDFLKKLRHFGLNSYQAKLWTALLSRGVATAGELSDISNVPRSRAYDVLESLEKKGFIVMKIGKPIKYIAVKPSEVLERVKKKLKEDADKEVKKLESLKGSEVMQELVLLHSHGVEKVDPTELTASVKGRENLYNSILDMVRGAQKEVVISTTADGLVRKAEVLKSVFKDLSKKGVKVRIAAPINESTESVVKELQDVAELRHSNVDSRFCIVDGKKVMFMIVNDKDVNSNYDSGISVSSEFFAQNLKQMFDASWKALKKVE